MPLIAGHPLLDLTQSVTEAEQVEALLEAEVAHGPDVTQVRQHGWMLPLGRCHVLWLCVEN